MKQIKFCVYVFLMIYFLFSLICSHQLAGRGLIKGRDHLMWVLLQFISGSIQKNALADFLPVMKLFDLLYPEKEVQVIATCTVPFLSCFCLVVLLDLCFKYSSF